MTKTGMAIVVAHAILLPMLATPNAPDLPKTFVYQEEGLGEEAFATIIASAILGAVRTA
jgi:hypothetical protein